MAPRLAAAAGAADFERATGATAVSYTPGAGRKACAPIRPAGLAMAVSLVPTPPAGRTELVSVVPGWVGPTPPVSVVPGGEGLFGGAGAGVAEGDV
jgi:hypothetical protein